MLKTSDSTSLGHSEEGKQNNWDATANLGPQGRPVLTWRLPTAGEISSSLLFPVHENTAKAYFRQREGENTFFHVTQELGNFENVFILLPVFYFLSHDVLKTLPLAPIRASALNSRRIHLCWLIIQIITTV